MRLESYTSVMFVQTEVVAGAEVVVVVIETVDVVGIFVVVLVEIGTVDVELVVASIFVVVLGTEVVVAEFMGMVEFVDGEGTVEVVLRTIEFEVLVIVVFTVVPMVGLGTVSNSNNPKQITEQFNSATLKDLVVEFPLIDKQF